MLNIHRLSLAEAEIAVDAAVAKASQLGVGSVVVVCDNAGWPIVLKRPDNAKATSVEIAINKAFTAACHRRPTHTYTNAQSGGEAFGIMNMHGGRFAIFVGGWPIEVDGEVVGGIGVSGGHTLPASSRAPSPGIPGTGTGRAPDCLSYRFPTDGASSPAASAG